MYFEFVCWCILYLCIFVFVFVLILAMIQDQALVASKHFLVETEDKNLADTVGEVLVGDSAEDAPSTGPEVRYEDGDDMPSLRKQLLV